MPDSLVPCPACAAETAVPAGGSARCPGCGLVVAERRAAPAPVEEPPSRVGTAVVFALAVGGVVVLAAGGVAYFTHRERVSADQHMRRAMEAEEHERRAARDAADRMRVIDAEGEVRDLADQLPLALGGAAPLPEVAHVRANELAKTVVGTWRGAGANGGTREVEYRAAGTFRDAVTGGDAPRSWAGRWEVGGLHGSRVLVLARAGGGPKVVRITIEGGELVHDDEPGRATVLRRP